MMNIDKCPKCGAEMQEGFLIESKLPLRWIAGKPKTSVLGGTQARGTEQRQIESYRCVGCGYLESYARADIS
jgi:predicted nucleic-acid-binding Zn-ribbon protein